MTVARSNVAIGALGALGAYCWWRIRELGDARLRLGDFYGWYAAAFGVYLLMLWGVRRWQAQGLSRRAAAAGLGLILLSAAAFRLLLLPAIPTLSDDIYRYAWDGRVQLAGFDPYAYPPDHPALQALRTEQFRLINFPHLRTVYPPLTELWLRLGAWLGGSLTALKALMILAELATIVSLLIILRLRRRSPLWVAAYAWHPLAVLEIAGSGHNDALGVALLWAGVAAWEARRVAAAAGAWALAFLAKFGSAVLVPWWWARREGRRWMWLLAAAALLPVLLLPTLREALFGSFSAMAERGESNASLCLILSAVLGGGGVARAACVAVWAIALVWWSRREADPVRYVVCAMTAGALLAPVLHPWYLLWLVPGLCVWRPRAVMALTGTVVLAYTVWPDYLAHGRWALPLRARLLEYLPVFGLLAWELTRCAWQSFFLPATKPTLSVRS
jgi:hypothetical protein